MMRKLRHPVHHTCDVQEHHQPSKGQRSLTTLQGGYKKKHWQPIWDCHFILLSTRLVPQFPKSESRKVAPGEFIGPDAYYQFCNKSVVDGNELSTPDNPTVLEDPSTRMWLISFVVPTALLYQVQRRVTRNHQSSAFWTLQSSEGKNCSRVWCKTHGDQPIT